MRQPLLYSKIEVGDLSAQKEVRRRLRCKPFRWFMKNVAFDLIKRFPLDEPSFAYGGIKNLGINMCADTMSRYGNTQVGVFWCTQNLTYPHLTQTFSLTLKHEIRERFEQRCWSQRFDKSVWFVPCASEDHIPDERTLWRYDTVRRYIAIYIFFCWQ